MDKKNIIIFSDLDGTLLHDDYIFSPKTIEVVEKLYNQGIYLVPITARTIKDLKQKASLLQIDKFKELLLQVMVLKFMIIKLIDLFLIKHYLKNLLKKCLIDIIINSLLRWFFILQIVAMFLLKVKIVNIELIK